MLTRRDFWCAKCRRSVDRLELVPDEKNPDRVFAVGVCHNDSSEIVFTADEVSSPKAYKLSGAILFGDFSPEKPAPFDGHNRRP